jgi:hypothetical protein
MLTCHCIDEEKDDESFMGVERVPWELGHKTPTETGLRTIWRNNFGMVKNQNQGSLKNTKPRNNSSGK